MLIKKPSDIPYSEVTPKAVYMNRRKFLAGVAAATGAATLAARPVAGWLESESVFAAETPLAPLVKSPFSSSEPQTPFKDATHYNNYYEFGTDKSDPARNATKFQTSPWSVSVEGEVNKPRTFDIEEIRKLAPLEERIYRHRCVEAWSIVVPWIGYSFSTLAKLVDPKPTAKFVAFQTYYDVKQMPLGPRAGIRASLRGGAAGSTKPCTRWRCWPSACMGETLPNQDGAPVRMVLPWKYGFKSIKSLVKIRFVKDMPPTTWNIANAHEYGFYSNVNPQVDHPRWSQATRTTPGWFVRRKDGYKTRCSTATQTRSRACTPAWTCGRTTKAYFSSRANAMDLSRHINVRWIKPPVFLLVSGACGDISFGRASTMNSARIPVEFIRHSTGTWTLVGLCITSRDYAAASYAAPELADSVPAHVGFVCVLLRVPAPRTYVWIRLRLRFSAMITDVYKRPFITVGFTAFVLMVPLALTSTSGMIRRLGGRRWQMLHRLDLLTAIARSDSLLLAGEVR